MAILMATVRISNFRVCFGRLFHYKRYIWTPIACMSTLQKRNTTISAFNGSSSVCYHKRLFGTGNSFFHDQTGIEKPKHNDCRLTSTDDSDVLYRFRWIKHVRFVSRVKILHVAVVTGLTWPMSYWFTTGFVSFPVLISAVIGALGTTGGLVALSYFFRRVVGELSADDTTQTITISTLTFWGNRRDRTYPICSLIPLDDSGIDLKNTFHRLEINGAPDVFLLSLRHGRILHESFFRVIGLVVNQGNNTKGTILAREKMVKSEN